MQICCGRVINSWTQLHNHRVSDCNHGVSDSTESLTATTESLIATTVHGVSDCNLGVSNCNHESLTATTESLIHRIVGEKCSRELSPTYWACTDDCKMMPRKQMQDMEKTEIRSIAACSYVQKTDKPSSWWTCDWWFSTSVQYFLSSSSLRYTPVINNSPSLQSIYHTLGVQFVSVWGEMEQVRHHSVDSCMERAAHGLSRAKNSFLIKWAGLGLKFAGLGHKLLASPGPFYRNVNNSKQSTCSFTTMHKHEVTPKSSYQTLSHWWCFL